MNRRSRDILSRVFLELDRFVSENFCVAFSGGSDSLFLLYALKMYPEKKDLWAVHINHGIRGQESDQDELFCRDICEKWNIPLKVFSEDVPLYAKKHSLSVEMAARECRYAIFRRLRRDFPNLKIVTAHHLDDDVETILMRLFKGSGTRALSGISRERDGIIRPLLSVSKEEILFVLNDLGLDFRTDSSNLSLASERNYIRHKIVPVIEDRFFAFKKKIAELKQILEEENLFFESLLSSFEGIVQEEERLIFDKHRILRRFPDPALQVRLILYFFQAWLPDAYLDFESVRRIRGFLSDDKGSKIVYASKRFRVLSLYENLVFEKSGRKLDPFFYYVKLYLPVKRVIGNYRLSIQESSFESEKTGWQTALFLREAVLIVRNRKDGDRIRIEGNHHKKVKKILIDAKVPRDQRNRALVFCSENGELLMIFSEKLGFRRAYREDLSGSKFFVRIEKIED